MQCETKKLNKSTKHYFLYIDLKKTPHIVLLLFWSFWVFSWLTHIAARVESTR